jgi:hypothetical protein
MIGVGEVLNNREAAPGSLLLADVTFYDRRLLECPPRNPEEGATPCTPASIARSRAAMFEALLAAAALSLGLALGFVIAWDNDLRRENRSRRWNRRR